MICKKIVFASNFINEKHCFKNRVTHCIVSRIYLDIIALLQTTERNKERTVDNSLKAHCMETKEKY